MAVRKTGNKKGFIYKITTPSGKFYIGQTTQINKRKAFYRGLCTKKQQLLHKSLLKYGFEACSFDILEECVAHRLCKREMYWIGFYQANHIKFPTGNGLNLTDGGEGSTGYRHSPESVKLRIAKRALTWKPLTGKRPKEWCENISKSLTGKKLSAEHCIKIGISKKGNTYRRGTTASLEQKQKQSISMKGKPAWNKNKATSLEVREKQSLAKARMVFDLQTGIFYQSLKEASFAKNINIGTLLKKIKTQNRFDLMLAS